MALSEQLLEVPITGGPNEKDDAVLSMRPVTMTNCLERKTGSVSKRYGYALLATNARVGGGTPPAPKDLFAYRDTLVRIGSGEIDAYAPTKSATPWAARGRVPEAIATHRTLAISTTGTAYDADPSVAVGNGYTAVVYTALTDGALSPPTGTQSLLLEVEDNTTGQRVVIAEVVATASLAVPNYISCQRAVISGTRLGVFWLFYDGVTPRLYGRWFSLSSLTWETAATSIVTGVSIGPVLSQLLDAGAISSTRWILAYVDGASQDVHVIDVDNTGAITTNLTVGAAQTAGVLSLSLHVTAQRAWCAWLKWDGAANLAHRVCTVSVGSPIAVDVAYVTVLTSGHASTPATFIGVAQNGTTSDARLVVTTNETNSLITRVHALTRTGGGAITYTAVTHYDLEMTLVARPFSYGGRMYAWVYAGAPNAATRFLIDVWDTVALGESPRIVATAAPRLDFKGHLFAISDVAAMPDGTTFRVVGASAGDPPTAVEVFDVAFNFERTACQFNGILVLGGGAPSIYDGSNVTEIGFAYEPDMRRFGSAPAYGFATAVTGALTPSATYSYAFVFVWADAAGNVHRSAPSLTPTVTLGAGDGKVNGSIPMLNLTSRNAPSATEQTSVYVEVYRTLANGTVFHYHSQVRNRVDLRSQAFADTTADSAIAGNRTLYTTGGVVANQIPSSASVAAVWKGAIVLAGTDDGSVWFSRPIVSREGPGFSGALTQAPFENGDVTALGEILGSLVVFKSSAIYRITGEPPDDLGTASLTAPEYVHADVGCVAAKSLVQTPDGIEFPSETGLALLDRSWNVVWHGKAIETTFASATWVGAAVIPSQNLVRFARSGGSSSLAVRDYYHSRLRQVPQWSVDVPADPDSSGNANIAACATLGGTFVFITAGGSTYQENTANFADIANAVTTTITSTFECAFQRPASTNGRFRCWSVAALGTVASSGVTITVTSDRDTQAETWSSADATSAGGQFRVRPRVREVSRLKVKIQDAPETTTGGLTALRAISLQIGIEPGHKRLKNVSKK